MRFCTYHILQSECGLPLLLSFGTIILYACVILQDAAARKQRLKRFGHAVSEQAGDSVTVRGTEDIPFDRVQKTRQTTEEKRAEKEDLKSALQGSDKSAVVGR